MIWWCHCTLDEIGLCCFQRIQSMHAGWTENTMELHIFFVLDIYSQTLATQGGPLYGQAENEIQSGQHTFFDSNSLMFLPVHDPRLLFSWTLPFLEWFALKYFSGLKLWWSHRNIPIIFFTHFGNFSPIKTSKLLTSISHKNTIRCVRLFSIRKKFGRLTFRQCRSKTVWH